LFLLLPYIEQGNAYNATYPNNDTYNGGLPTYSEYGGNGVVFKLVVKNYVCPSDPTNQSAPQGPWNQTLASYAANGQVFVGSRWNSNYGRFPAAIADGTSNTIFFTEKEAVTQSTTGCPGGQLTLGYNYWQDWGALVANSEAGQPTGPGPSYFQIQPKPSGQGSDCLASTGHTASIQCGMGDGSVRGVSQGVSPQSWWNALTPANGDLLGSDW
jgi:hypothetical protein